MADLLVTAVVVFDTSPDLAAVATISEIGTGIVARCTGDDDTRRNTSRNASGNPMTVVMMNMRVFNAYAIDASVPYTMCSHTALGIRRCGGAKLCD
ncbi:MAG: hypothetical protein ABL894_03845 [Hyphomicrobium sp.]